MLTGGQVHQMDLSGQATGTIKKECERLVEEPRLSRRGDANSRPCDPARQVVLEVFLELLFGPKRMWDIRHHDSPQPKTPVGMVVVEWRQGMKRVLRMRMGIILCVPFSLNLTSGAIGSSEDVLCAVVEGAFAYPVERSKPRKSNPDEKNDMNPQERKTLGGCDQRGY